MIMSRTTGYVLIGVGVAVAAILYFMQNRSRGPAVPNSGSGFGPGNPAGGSGPESSCGATICLGASSDGSGDAVSVQPQSQTEGAYNISPTDTADAFGANENTSGSDVEFV